MKKLGSLPPWIGACRGARRHYSGVSTIAKTLTGYLVVRVHLRRVSVELTGHRLLHRIEQRDQTGHCSLGSESQQCGCTSWYAVFGNDFEFVAVLMEFNQDLGWFQLGYMRVTSGLCNRSICYNNLLRVHVDPCLDPRSLFVVTFYRCPFVNLQVIRGPVIPSSLPVLFVRRISHRSVVPTDGLA